MWFNEVVPSLEKIDGMRMYLEIFAAVHTSAHEPSQRVADSEIKPFYVCRVDLATGINTKGLHNFIRISKYDTFGGLLQLYPSHSAYIPVRTSSSDKE